MNILHPNYPWLGKNIFNIRSSTDAIVIHHSAGTGSAEFVDKLHQHRNPPYAAIGYHYYIRRNGEIYRGRPEHVVGAHTYGGNSSTIGVCFEGNYEITMTMPEPQFNSGQELLGDILMRYGNLNILKHSSFSATACPGRYFPFERMIDLENKKPDNTFDSYDVIVRVGGTDVNAKLIDGVTYVCLRPFIDAVKGELSVTWTPENGAGVKL